MLRRLVVGNVILTLLFIVAASEAALLHWGIRVSGGSGLGGGSAALAVTGLMAVNAVLLVVLRSLPWRVRPIYWTSRAYVLVSLGAMISGPPLLAFLLLELPLAWVFGPEAGRVAFLAGGASAATLGFGGILWGFAIGQRRLAVEEVDVPVRELPAAFEGIRIAHLSDLHIGRQLRADRLRRFVDRANAVGCDLIVITGDLFDFDPAFIGEGCRELARLSAPMGVYGVLGNHDVYTGAEAVAEGLERFTSIHLLRDEWVWLHRGESRLGLIGIDDPGRGWTDRDSRSEALDRLAKKVPPGVPRILLAHRPSYFRQAARLGVDVVLSGHTHGGQISLPSPFQHHNVSRLIAHWTRGRFELDGAFLYVNRGLGVAGPPVRLNCPREIAVLRLVARP